MILEDKPRVNRFDQKWSLPAFVEGNAYVIGFNEEDPLKELMSKSNEEVAEIQRKRIEKDAEFFASFTAVDPLEAYDHQIYAVDSICPEEHEDVQVRFLVAVPKKRRKKMPVVFEIPGGGLTNGGSVEFALATTPYDPNPQQILVLCQYRIAPIHQYPSAINDLQSIYMWVMEHAEEFSIDPEKVVINGGSAGGILALALTFRLKRYGWHGNPMPRGVTVSAPMMDDATDLPSGHISFKCPEGYEAQWSSVTNEMAMMLYLGDRFGDPTLPPEAVPSRATLEDVKGFPPTWIYTAEHDCGRDSCYRFAELLHEAGIFCDFHCCGGASHTSSMVAAQPNMEDPLDIANRLGMIMGGQKHDALKYDMRRPWLD